MIGELDHSELRKVIDVSEIPCKTTEELTPLDEIIGQERALKALQFGLGIQEPGFNIFAAGRPGTGKTTTVRSFVEDKAETEEPPSDWCYVYNYENPREPNAIRLPQGRAKEFKGDMEELIDDIRKVLPEAFQGEDYAVRRENIIKSASKKRDELISKVNETAKEKGFVLQQSQTGLLVVPMKDGEPMSQKQISMLPQEELEEITKKREEINTELRNAMRELRKMETEIKKKIDELNKEIAKFAIDPFFQEMMERYKNVDEVEEYLRNVEEDILENIETFLSKPDKSQPSGQSRQAVQAMIAREQFFKKYEVNILVDNSGLEGAPVIFEGHPTFYNLFGKVEREARYGVLTTDFTMIRSGSIHKANGGYLMIPAEELLRVPGSYQAIKRALKNQEIVIEELQELAGVLSTRGLKPEPIQMKVKIIIVGNSRIYDLLYRLDDDFRELWKVKAHFDTSMEMTQENMMKYASAMTNVCGKEGLKHMDAGGVAKVLEYSARLAEDKEELSTQFAEVADIVREATYYAKLAGAEYVTAEHVSEAIEQRYYRSNLIQEKIQEMIERGTILIDTDGKRVGQINGLTVMSLGDIRFGGPSRVTASVGVGRSGIVDVARETEMGGPIHSKGVLIIGGYLSKTFARNRPLGITARLVFEQSYSGVDGDSASSTELYAILSDLSGISLRQDIAVTGSVSQNGEVQAIGGVNEKIEGFFEICKAKGLTGEQGVMIPKSNVRNLMLKEEVVQAVKDGKFHVYAVETISEGIEVLTGVKAGERKEDGTFEEGTVFYKVDQKLQEMAEILKEYPDSK